MSNMKFTFGRQRPCPVCGAEPNKAKLFLEANYDAAKVDAFSFASRKVPEFMCHRFVQCGECDLVYVDRPPLQDELAHAYHEASYDSSEEAEDAATAYIRAMAPAIAKLPTRQRALEIGTGTGALLAHLRGAGFTELVGVEPSSAAIAAAPAHRKEWIREGIFVEKDFQPESFDLVCCFMTLEHVLDPAEIADSVLRLLRPGGAFVTVTHDYRSFVNRILGRRSPIIDIEHMQLFSEPSICALFERHGFRDVSAQSFANRYALRYWLRLAPLPSSVRGAVASATNAVGLDAVKLSVNVGNTMAYGFKPA